MFKSWEVEKLGSWEVGRSRHPRFSVHYGKVKLNNPDTYADCSSFATSFVIAFAEAMAIERKNYGGGQQNEFYT
jgi:hypothetical protein